MRARIYLETIRDVRDFVETISKLGCHVALTDEDKNMKVNATSLIGVMYSTEWGEIYCESKEDITKEIERYMRA